MSSYVVQVSGHLPPHALDRIGSVRRQTVLRTSMRDQAALYGFLGVLNELALELVDLRQLTPPWAPDVPRPRRHSVQAEPFVVEVVIDGPIGDLAVSTLANHAEITHEATRLVLSDPLLLGEVLDWARGAGAAVEFATDVPA
jgi:hypothetical protein